MSWVDLLTHVVSAATVLLWLLALAVGASSVGLWRNRKEEREWTREQVQRAIEQVNSTDEAEILAGCQTLYVLGASEAEVRRRLLELTRASDSRVVLQASVTYGKLAAQGG